MSLDGIARRKVNFFDIVEILKNKSSLKPKRQKEIIQNAINYFTSARDLELFSDQKITSYDIRGDYDFASENLYEFKELMDRGMDDKSSITFEDYLEALNYHIYSLNAIKDLDKSPITKKREERLSNFLFEYQRQLNISS